jgi:Tol biopolymer transport system component
VTTRFPPSSRHTRFISSTRVESAPQFSDGNKIAFESTRSGAYEIWVCRGDGSGLIQLTNLNSVSGTPRWSPDGQRIAFESRSTGNPDIFVVDSQGGPPRKITSESSHELLTSFSRDGHWIYFASNRTGAWQIWKMPSTAGPAVQVTHNGGFAAFESLDGSFLYYAKGPGVAGLWRIPTDGGEETQVISSLQAVTGAIGLWSRTESITWIRRPRNQGSLSLTSRPIGVHACSICRIVQPAQCPGWPSLRTKRQSFTHN